MPDPNQELPDQRGEQDVSARLRRLEEHAGFTEHTVDQLSREIVLLHRRLDAMTQNVAALEARLKRLSDSETSQPEGAGGDSSASDPTSR